MAALTARLSRQVLVMSQGPRPTRTSTEPGFQTAVVTLPAEIDVSNGEHSYDALAGALRSGAAVVVADASGTTFCGCAGVTALIRAHHRAAAAQAQLRVAASPAVRRILELTRADRVLSTYPTVAAALHEQQHPAGSNGNHPRLRTRKLSGRIGPRHVTIAGLLAMVARVRRLHPMTGPAAR
jgi:anti-sigma B factor antagonist